MCIYETDTVTIIICDCVFVYKYKEFFTVFMFILGFCSCRMHLDCCT